jgi:YfiH family protein
MSVLPSAISWLHTEEWRQFSGLVHGFSARLGDPLTAQAQFTAQGLQLHTLKQVHGDDIVIVTHDTPMKALHERPEADGLMSATSGALLGIATADCVPILLVAPQHGVAAALHAGWRGTLKGIVQRAVALLAAHWQVEPRHLHAALGPSIGGCCYEVGPEVGEAMMDRWRSQTATAWRPSAGGKGFLDLRMVNSEQLAEMGVPRTQISRTGPCTFCDPAFASYRRDGAQAGRQLSVIGWR